MNLKDYQQAGGFDPKLFIGGIDVEIGIRLHGIGKAIGVLGNAFIMQRFGNSQERRFLWKKVHPYFGGKNILLYKNKTKANVFGIP